MSDAPAIDLKKRARRRLVGAAALALLAVIVLPIVMDSEPKPGGQEIQIRIPNRDSDSVVARVIPGSPAASPLPKNTEPPRQAAPAVPDGSSVAPEAAVGKSVSPAERPIAAATKTEVAAAKTAPAAKIEVAHAEAALEGKDAGQWIVQLGAYQNVANVKQLISKLKAMGIAFYTEKLDSSQGQRTRVRAGPFKSQDAADSARLRIKKIGVDGTIAQKQ